MQSAANVGSQTVAGVKIRVNQDGKMWEEGPKQYMEAKARNPMPFAYNPLEHWVIAKYDKDKAAQWQQVLAQWACNNLLMIGACLDAKNKYHPHFEQCLYVVRDKNWVPSLIVAGLGFLQEKGEEKDNTAQIIELIREGTLSEKDNIADALTAKKTSNMKFLLALEGQIFKSSESYQETLRKAMNKTFAST